MKKLLAFVALVAVVAYVVHRNRPKEGAFDKAGNPIVRVFVAEGCAQWCADVEDLMAKRKVVYERIDIGTPEGQAYGVSAVPTTMVGRRSVRGNDLDGIVGLLAETYGSDVLTRLEQLAMAGHFDESGRPRVVMYATQWCGYCKRLREFFTDNAIAFVEIDVEASPEGRNAFEALRGRGYPTVYVGYRRFGYEGDEIKAAVAELQ
jgi:glutaredoxin